MRRRAQTVVVIVAGVIWAWFTRDYAPWSGALGGAACAWLLTEIWS